MIAEAPMLASIARRSLAAALGAGLLLCALARPAAAQAACASAYCRSTAGAGGPCLFWSTRGHSFMIDAKGTPDVAGPTAFDAVRKSFATWAAVSCSDLQFPDLGLSTNPDDRRIGYVPGGANRNLVLWRTASCAAGGAPPNDPCLQTPGSCGNKYDCWDHGDNVIAVTTTTFSKLTGQIYDADIELNDALHSDGSKFQFTTVQAGPTCTQTGQSSCIAFDVQNTVTHEAGHSIGFDHPNNQDSTMYAFAPEGDTTKRQLHASDIQGVCTVYPKGKATVTCIGDPITLTAAGSSDGGGCGCHSNGGAASAIAGAIAFALYLRLRRR